MPDRLTPEQVRKTEVLARMARSNYSAEVLQVCREWREQRATIQRLERKLATQPLSCPHCHGARFVPCYGSNPTHMCSIQPCPECWKVEP